MSLGKSAGPFTVRANMRYSAGGIPCTVRNARLKSPGLEKPHRAAIAATGREASDGSERSLRQQSSRCFLIQPATVRPSSWKSCCRERSDMWWAAAIMAGHSPGSPRYRRTKACTWVSCACLRASGVSQSCVSSSCDSRVARTSSAAVDRRAASAGL